MAQQTIAYLKSRFQTGATPSQQDYSDIFDSYVHYNDLETANNTAIDARISDYDSDLKSLSGSGSVASLGDLLDIFVGYDSETRLKTVLNALGGAPSWEAVGDKPDRINLVWDEVQVSLDSYVAANQPAPPASSMQVIQPISLASLPGGPGIEKRAVIRDMQVTFFPVQWHGSSFTTFAQRINTVTFGVEPRISLQ